VKFQKKSGNPFPGKVFATYRRGGMGGNLNTVGISRGGGQLAIEKISNTGVLIAFWANE